MKNIPKQLIYGVLLSIVLLGRSLAAQDLGQVANNILEPVTVVSQFISTACIVLGGAFLFTSVIKYIEHRRNPLASPIGTVIFLFIAGVILIFLPIITMYSGSAPS